jgi:hypothetical protein
MPSLRRLLPLVIAALALALVACDEDAPTQPASPAATGTPMSPTSTAVTGTAPALEGLAPFAGIAGLVPPNYPNPSDDDWRALYGAIPGLGGWVGTYASWSPEAGLPDVVVTQEQVGAQLGFQTLPIVGFHRDLHPGVEVLVDFTDATQVSTFAGDLAEYAASARPPLLGIGNEVNRIQEADPAAYREWVAALPGIVHAIREASPATRIFVTFQYEFVRGAGALSGQARAPQWDMVAEVAPYLDVVVFTTYPYFDYAHPDDIPADYYRDAVQRLGVPVAFSEVGWPSGPLSVAPASPFGGTPAEQRAFIERLPDLLEGVDPAFVMWVWAYDIGEIVGPTFATVGLSENDGTSKPALGAWSAFIEGFK